MKNQTVHNMELLSLEMLSNVLNVGSNSKAVKTLVHSYQVMLHGLESAQDKEDVYDSQLYNLKRIQDAISTTLIPKLLLAGDYIAVNNYSIVLEKLNRCILEIEKAGKGVSASIKASTIVEEMLDMSIKNGVLITYKDEVHRGMGTTTALVKKAAEIGCVLICGTTTQATHAKEIAQSLGLDVCICAPRKFIHDGHVRQQLVDKGFIVDVLVTKEEIRELQKRDYKLLGGFYRILV